MKDVFKIVGGLLLGVALLAAIGWGLTLSGLYRMEFFAPKFEEVRRNTFEQSKAYRDGMAQELMALQVEYLKADPSIKPALAGVIKHKAAGLPENTLPYQLSLFIKELP